MKRLHLLLAAFASSSAFVSLVACSSNHVASSSSSSPDVDPTLEIAAVDAAPTVTDGGTVIPYPDGSYFDDSGLQVIPNDGGTHTVLHHGNGCGQELERCIISQQVILLDGGKVALLSTTFGVCRKIVGPGLGGTGWSCEPLNTPVF